MGIKKIVGTALSSLMLLNPAFDVTYAANTKAKNLEKENKILKCTTGISCGILAVIGALFTGGMIYCSRSEEWIPLRRSLILDFESGSVDFDSRNPKIKDMISKCVKEKEDFVVITKTSENSYIIQRCWKEECTEIIEIDKQEFDSLLGGLYKESRCYYDTEEVFKRISSMLVERELQYRNLNLKDRIFVNYSLTAVIFDKETDWEKFEKDILEYEIIRVNDEFCCIKGIPNRLKEYGMNTLMDSEGCKTVMKLIPINVKELKENKELLRQCSSKIILFDWDSHSLNEKCEGAITTKDCKILKVDYSLDNSDARNHQLKEALKWINIYAYGSSNSDYAKDYIRKHCYRASKLI